ncbi:MAG: hypothetical protein PHN84_15935, partial [Desulfuromonadaceae bacterium]|nr:hypothetical protein [Desulfuromonadaceae bacterium]
SIRAIKKAAPKKAAQYLFRWGGFKLVFDFIAFFLPRSGLVQRGARFTRFAQSFRAWRRATGWLGHFLSMCRRDTYYLFSPALLFPYLHELHLPLN